LCNRNGTFDGTTWCFAHCLSITENIRKYNLTRAGANKEIFKDWAPTRDGFAK